MLERDEFWTHLAERAEASFQDRIVWIVDNILRGAIEYDASRVLFRKRVSQHGKVSPDDCAYRWSEGGKYSFFTVHLEIGDSLHETASLSIVEWLQLISRLKIVASMVDYGPQKSMDSTFHFVVDGQKLGTFRLTSNPNPYNDSEVELEVSPAPDVPHSPFGR